MVDPLTLSVATCAMVGFNIVLMVAMNSRRWYHNFSRWATSGKYNIVKVYKAASPDHFNLFTIFLDFFLNQSGQIPSTERSIHLTACQIDGRSYYTIMGKTFLKITTKITEARRRQLNLSSTDIEFWIYGIGDADQLPIAYEYWVKPKYTDDINQMLLIFAKLAGYNPIDAGALFPITSHTMTRALARTMIALNLREMKSFYEDTSALATEMPMIMDARPQNLGGVLARIQHNPNAVFALSLSQGVPKFDDPVKLSIHLRDLIFRDLAQYPATARTYAAPVIIQNLPTFMVMKARELKLNVKFAGSDVRKMIRENKYAIDNFFKTVIAQHADYPGVKQYLEIVYYLLKSEVLPRTVRDIAQAFRILPIAAHTKLIQNAIPERSGIPVDETPIVVGEPVTATAPASASAATTAATTTSPVATNPAVQTPVASTL